MSGKSILCFLIALGTVGSALLSPCAFGQKGSVSTNVDRGISPAKGEWNRNFQVVTFPSGKLKLSGILWQPQGTGPFPAIIYNHGSEQTVANKAFAAIGNFYLSHGYAVLVPIRRGHSYQANLQPVCSSEGTLFDDRVNQETGFNFDPSKRNKIWIHEQEVDNEDVEAAAAWLRGQPFVNSKAMIMSGISFGGIQTCLASEKGLGMRAFIPFAPGAMSWKWVPEVHARLKQALEDAKAPVFLIQAENDYDTGPSEYLGPVLVSYGPPILHFLYPAFHP